MVMYSSQIQQQIMMQQQQAAMQMQAAQQMSQRFGTAPHMGAVHAMQHGAGGVYGEHMAQRLGNMGQTAVGLGGMGLGIAGMFTGMPLDPFSAALGAGRAGFAMGGMGGAMLGAAAGIAPFYMASQAASVYGGAFFGGMGQQSQLNSTLRSNFNFQGGQGAFGRGFSQQQMGQVGQMVSAEARQSPFTSSQEMNDLIGGGAEAGMFTAVRDVQQFSQRFKTMIDSLRKIQKELGGTLSEALSFTRGAQQLGIFSSGSRTAFAADMRDTMATTGMSQDQLFGLAAQGSMLSRATGGVGRQGAVGALKMARTLGGALSSGVINQEALSEATGGLTGTEAIQAFTGRMMQQTERFSRRGMGRFSIFALSNEEGTGLDGGSVDRFLAGDISTGGVMRDAHGKVNKMGRARAMNREGMLRGALMEQGGLAGQIGMMRLMVGDRVMDQGDDLGSLVMQRRFGMNRPESEMMMSLMRNQGSIAQTEGVERAMSGRETRMRQDISENRSIDAFMEHLQHGLQDATGVTKVREMGRNFMTKISSLVERTMNDVLGIEASALNVGDKQSFHRLTMGMATSDDLERLQMGGAKGSGGGADPFSKPLAQRVLSGLGLHSTQSVGEAMRSRGTDIAGLSPQQQDTAIRRMQMAQAGRPEGMQDTMGFAHLMRDRTGTLKRIASAELIASATGNNSDLYRGFDASSNAIDAFRKRNGMDAGITAPLGSLLGQAGGADESLQRTGMNLLRGGLSLFGGPTGTLIGDQLASATGISSMSDQDKALEFVSKGGHFMKGVRKAGELRGDRLKNFLQATGITGEEASKLGDYKGVDREAMRGFMESDSFQTSVRRLQRMKGSPEAQEKELAAMEAAASKDPNRAAAVLAVREVRFNLEMNKGSIGKEFMMMSQQKVAELQGLAREAGSQYMGLAEGATGELKGMLGEIGNQFYGYDTSGAAGGISALQSKLADMDPNSAAYREAAGALGGSDIGRNLLMGSSMQRAFTRDASGGGRRGRNQQAETVLGSLTGGSMGSMEFSIDGRQVGRRNQARTIFDQFSKGGKHADELEAQLTTQLSELIGGDASGKVKEMRGLIAGGVSKEEAKAIFDKFEKDPELQRVKREGFEKMQRDRDPLGVQRNDLLSEIRTGINKLVEKGGDGGVNMSNPT